MRVAIFTTYNATPSNPNMYEFVEKNTHFLVDTFNEITYIELKNNYNNNSYFDYLTNSIKKYNPNISINKLEIDIQAVVEDFKNENGVRLDKHLEVSKYIALLNEFDCFFTYGNFVTFSLNNDSNKSNLKFNELIRYNFDLSLPYYVNFLVMNELLQQTNIPKKIQYYSDPLDIPFTSVIKATPDTQYTTVFDVFLPLYQYYYTEVNKSSNNTLKSNMFVMGNSCGDEYRKYLFDRYVLAFYEQHKDDDRYKFYASGYKNHKVVLDNFIDHNLFYEELEKSYFGLVLNTYSKDFISANKISMMLSRNCLPIITEGSDEKSGYIPEHIRNEITVKSSIELESVVNMDKNKREKLLKELQYYYQKDNYLEIIKGVMD